MATDYGKLVGDLIRAKAAAEIEALGEDTGCINLDAIAIFLPRTNAQKVIEVVKDAGLVTYGKNHEYGSRYFINPPKCGQASSRERAVQAMYRVMIEAGWEVMIYKERH